MKNIAASANTPKSKKHHSTVVATGQIRSTLEHMYKLAFFDAATRNSGRFGRVFAFFTGGARGSAAAHARLLTISGAGNFSVVSPGGASLRLRIFLDRFGNAIFANAIARFTARGTRLNGKVEVIAGTAQYFLARVPGHWVINAFQVHRSGHPAQ